MSDSGSKPAEPPSTLVIPVKTESRSRRSRARLVFALKLIAGTSLVAFLVWHFDLRSTFKLIRQERPTLFLATVALYVAGQAMSAFRWQLMAGLNGLGGRYSEYLAYYFIGMFTNVFVPGLIGGDALRALYLGRRHRQIGQAFGSVVADRGIGLLALFWLAAMAALWIDRVPLPTSVQHVALLAGGISLLGYLAAPLIAKWVSRAEHFNRVLAPILPYLCRPLALAPAIALSVLLQVSLAACQGLLALGLGLHIALTTFVFVVPITNVIASLPVTINGLGMREAGYLLLLGMAGVSKEQAVALSILYFAATLVGGFTGVIAFIMTPMPNPAAGESPNPISAERGTESRGQRRAAGILS